MPDHNRKQLINGLRALATFLEDRPGVSAPRELTINTFVDSLDDLKAQAALFGSAEKRWATNYFYVIKKFGPVALELNIDRGAICKKIVRKVLKPAETLPEREVEEVEWECPEDFALSANSSPESSSH